MRTLLVCNAVVSLALFHTIPADAAEMTWKAGVAKAVITPQQPMWMAGYGGRTKPAESAFHDLWIKVLALEDASQHRAIILSSDTLGIPRTIYDNVCVAVESKFGLDRSQIMLCASHTHCGPVLRGALYDAYPLDDAQRKLIEDYSKQFEDTIVATVGEALNSLSPATVVSTQGTADFAVNRRNNREPEVPELRKANALKGPVDHSVPVLVVRGGDSKLKALVFGYACHNTTLDFYRWCGDYAGFAQYALEERHSGCAAMFYMGCGADQNPLPRRTVELAQEYGNRLADAVDAALKQPGNELAPTLKTKFEFVKLNLGPEPTREELQSLAGTTNYQERWASRILNQLDSGEHLDRTYTLPIQAWKLGNQLWISIGGEVVVDYALGFKQKFGPDTWIAGYCNDVPAYIPSLRVLEEDKPPRSGYEGNTSMLVYGMPAFRWADDTEERIVEGVDRLVDELE